MLCKLVYSIVWAKKISGHSHLAPYSAILGANISKNRPVPLRVMPIWKYGHHTHGLQQTNCSKKLTAIIYRKKYNHKKRRLWFWSSPNSTGVVVGVAGRGVKKVIKTDTNPTAANAAECQSRIWRLYGWRQNDWNAWSQSFTIRQKKIFLISIVDQNFDFWPKFWFLTKFEFLTNI